MSGQNMAVSRYVVRPQQLEELVEKCRLGETTAFDKLVDLYKDKIYNYVSRMVHDPIEAEDITQETFIKAYRNLPSFRGASTFQTWLYRIASNLTIDSVRKRRRSNYTCSLDAPVESEIEQGDFMSRELEDVATPDPHRDLETAELQRQVHIAIQRLSPKSKSAIVMFELQNLSYDEIAGILGCPLGTVKSRLFNARMELKAKLLSILPEFGNVLEADAEQTVSPERFGRNELSTLLARDASEFIKGASGSLGEFLIGIFHAAPRKEKFKTLAEYMDQQTGLPSKLKADHVVSAHMQEVMRKKRAV